MHGGMIQAPKRPIPRGPRRARPPLYIGPWMSRLGLRQVDIAEKVEITASYMSLIVKGDKYPSPGVLRDLAEAMDIPEHLLRQRPPDNLAVQATAGIDAATLARLAQASQRHSN